MVKKRKINTATTLQNCIIFMWNELEQGRCLLPDGNADRRALSAASYAVSPGYLSFRDKAGNIVFLLWQHVHIGVPLEELTFKIGG